MLPVPPNVAPTTSLELDVDDGEVENYEVGKYTQCLLKWRLKWKKQSLSTI